MQHSLTKHLLGGVLLAILLLPVVGIFTAPIVMAAQSQDFPYPNDDGTMTTSQAVAASTAAAAANAQTPPADNSDPKKEVAGAKPSQKGALGELGSFIGNLILTLASAFVWVAGKIFDYSLENFVFGMGNWINSSGTTSIGGSIDQAWMVIRDIANLAFIFGFIYLGIRTIIDPDSASVKRTLSKIIIGALLINFSLFIVKFVVDFSNLLSYHIYTSLVSGNGGISGALMDRLGLSGIYKTPDPGNMAKITSLGEIWFYVMCAILLVISAYVLISAAILLLTRFVVLVFLMIGSPVLFAASVFPKTEGIANDLWKKLFSYSFFAPVYLLLVLISMLLIGALKSQMSLVPMSDVISGQDKRVDAWGVIVAFIVMIFFMLKSLSIAKEFGIKGGEYAVNTIENTGRNIKNNTLGFAGRNTIGRLGNTVQEKIKKARESTHGGTRFAGFAGDVVFGGAATTAANAKYGGSKSYASQEKESKERDRARAKNRQVEDISKLISKSIAADENTALSDAEKETARMNMERAIAGASTEQLQSLLKKHEKGSKEYDLVTANMSAGQFDSLMKLKEEDLDDAKKSELGAARAQGIKDRYLNAENKKRGPGGQEANLGDVIGKMSGKELDAIGFNDVYLHAGKLSSKQLDDMTLTETAKARLKDKREVDLFAEFAPYGTATPASAKTFFDRVTNDTERAKLPKKILTDTKAAQHLNANVLNKILDNDSIGAPERALIKTNVEMAHGNNAFNGFFNTPAGSRY